MAFPTYTEVATRLGRTLTTAEQAIATAVIGSTTGLIAEAVGRDSDWAGDLDPVPQTLSELCIQKAIGAITNPSGVASHSETLGAYQHSETFPRAADIGVFLSPDERARVRRAVYGSSIASPRVGSVLDEVYPLGSSPTLQGSVDE